MNLAVCGIEGEEVGAAFGRILSRQQQQAVAMMHPGSAVRGDRQALHAGLLRWVRDGDEQALCAWAKVARLRVVHDQELAGRLVIFTRLMSVRFGTSVAFHVAVSIR